jgi:hypothetical protein
MNLLCLNPFGIAAISTTALVSRDGGLVYFTLLNDGDPGHNVLRLWCQLRRSAVVAIFPTQKRGHRTCDSGPRAGHVVLCQPASGSLILTQGALYAVGRILLYSSVCLLVDEWFVPSKGIAFGVMWAGTGFSGISVPYIFSWSLSHFSLHTMLRAWAVSGCRPLHTSSLLCQASHSDLSSLISEAVQS